MRTHFFHALLPRIAFFDTRGKKSSSRSFQPLKKLVTFNAFPVRWGYAKSSFIARERATKAQRAFFAFASFSFLLSWRRKVETENWKGLKREKNRGSREIDVEILRAARASFLRCQFWGWFAKDSYLAFRASSDFFSFLSPSFKAPLWLVSIFYRKACFK